MKIPFGKHQGQDTENVPMSYLWSLWELPIEDGPLKEAIRQRIEPERYDTRTNDERTASSLELKHLARNVLSKYQVVQSQHGPIPDDKRTPFEEDMGISIRPAP